MPSATAYFSPDYPSARARFRAAAHAVGAELHELAIDARGPRGETLAIDIAWLGSRTAKRVFLHTSGVHGVEAFAGSAIQLALLEAPPQPPAECALVLVHVLNPYGMAWLRRTNENNVDLNRNFLDEGSAWSGAPEIYRRIDRVLNPPTPPDRDFFYVQALWQMMRHGFRPLKQAVAQGQYEYPRGLFYGGKTLEQGPRRYIAWLRQSLHSARYVFGVDVHTGLGRWGADTLLLEVGVGATPKEALSTALEREVIVATDPRAAYRIRGGMGAMLPRVLKDAAVDVVLQELGTYPPLAVFHALREENRMHHWGTGGIEHPVKRVLLERLCPADAEWRSRALRRGTTVARAAAAWVYAGVRAAGASSPVA